MGVEHTGVADGIGRMHDLQPPRRSPRRAARWLLDAIRILRD